MQSLGEVKQSRSAITLVTKHAMLTVVVSDGSIGSILEEGAVVGCVLSECLCCHLMKDKDRFGGEVDMEAISVQKTGACVKFFTSQTLVVFHNMCEFKSIGPLRWWED